MEENKTIEVRFESDEGHLYELILKHCGKKGISPGSYIKELAKVDLAWGHFSHPRKTRRNKDEEAQK